MTFWDGSSWTQDPRARPPIPPKPKGRARDWLATIPIAILLPALILPFIPARANAPALSIDGPAVAAGEVTVSGSGFPERQRFQLAWDGTSESMPRVRSSSDGSFTTRITVPSSATPGPHTLTAFARASSSRRGGNASGGSLNTTTPVATTTVVVVTGSETPGAEPTPVVTPPPADVPTRTAPPATDPPPPPPTEPPPPSQDPNPPPPEPVGVNVRDFGAQGDGTTNDTAAFNAAQDAARAGSKVMYVPDGIYSLTRFFPKAGITIRGESRGNTVLKRHGLGVHAAGGFIHVVANDVTIKNLTIRGTGRRLSDSGATGRGDDILINAIGADRLQVLNVRLVDAQGCGIQTESLSGALFEDVSITDTYVRDNGYHGVALWAYHGTLDSTFRRITIDGADYAGIMIDAGTTTGTAASVNDNRFVDIVIRNAARYHILGGGIGAGWMFTGGRRNVVNRYEITDIPQGAALAFGSDQSGIGSTLNTLNNGEVRRIASEVIMGFGPGATGNTFDGGIGQGRAEGEVAGNTFRNWPGLLI